MAIGIELILLDDPGFVRLPPDARWFYVALCIEVLDSGHQQRRLEWDAILRLAGVDQARAGEIMRNLEDTGLLVRVAGKSINLPKAEVHFRRYGDRNNNEAPNDRKDAVLQLFRHWQNVHGKPQSRLTPTRRKVLRQRLADGYTVQQITDAIEGCKLSPFHQGDNSNGTVYDDLELICRNSDNLERFMQYKHNAQRQKTEERQANARKMPANAASRAETIKKFRNQATSDEDLL